MPSDYIVKPVYRAMQVLQCLGEEKQPRSLTEISHRVGFPKTTVYRYLRTLCECGLVAHDPQTELYRLGMRLYELGQLVDEQLRFKQVAKPFMDELRDRYNETVNLGILDGKDIIYVEMAKSRRSLRMQAQVGSRDPAWTTALGRAMLAFVPNDEWFQHLPSRLKPRTFKTVTSRAALKRELEETRRRGYAIDNEENEEGARCIGAPIFNHLARVVAAISISGPISRLGHQVEKEVATALMQAADSISEELGYHVGG